jgi:hypothetical protein
MRTDQRLAGELVERAGQAFGQPPAVDEDQVERCARISSSSRGWIADQIEVRPSPPAGPSGMLPTTPGFAMSSTGTSIESFSDFFAPASTMVTGR